MRTMQKEERTLSQAKALTITNAMRQDRSCNLVANSAKLAMVGQILATVSWDVSPSPDPMPVEQWGKNLADIQELVVNLLIDVTEHCSDLVADDSPQHGSRRAPKIIPTNTNRDLCMECSNFDDATSSCSERNNEVITAVVRQCDHFVGPED